MRLPLSLAAAAFVLASPALALPSATAGMADTSAAGGEATTVVLHCGMGRTRDAMGRCHHSFNRFPHHRQFKTYKRTHCTPVRTPHGPVGFCKI